MKKLIYAIVFIAFNNFAADNIDITKINADITAYDSGFVTLLKAKKYSEIVNQYSNLQSSINSYLKQNNFSDINKVFDVINDQYFNFIKSFATDNVTSNPFSKLKGQGLDLISKISEGVGSRAKKKEAAQLLYTLARTMLNTLSQVKVKCVLVN